MPVIGSTLFALASALSYGASDFIGGQAARRLSTLETLMLAQIAATTMAVLVAHGISVGSISPPMLVLGAIGGLSHVTAVAFLYHGLAHGRITIVAPLSGVLNIALPVVVDGVVLNGLGMLQGVGILLAAAAVCLVTRGAPEASAQADSIRSSVALGCASGLMFGIADLALGSVDVQSVSDAVMVARLVGAIGIAVVFVGWHRKAILAWPVHWLVPAGPPPVRLRPVAPGLRAHDTPALDRTGFATGVALALVAGLGDCLGHLGYVMSAATGEISIAVATSALFPTVSVLLAIVILKETVGRLQSLGLAISVGAVALLAGA